MNTENGNIYRGLEIQEAINRGEKVVEVSKEVAAIVEAGKAALSHHQSLAQITEAQRLAGLARRRDAYLAAHPPAPEPKSPGDEAIEIIREMLKQNDGQFSEVRRSALESIVARHDATQST